MRRCSTFRFFFILFQINCPDLPFTSVFLYLIAPVCRFPTSWTPGRSTSWSGRRWRPKKPPEGLRQRRNFVTTVILVMLASRSVAQVKYERSQEPQGRHIQQVPPPTNIWRSAESWNISFSQRRRRLTDPLIKALMCGAISGSDLCLRKTAAALIWK